MRSTLSLDVLKMSLEVLLSALLGFGLVWFSLIWFDLVWFGLVWVIFDGSVAAAYRP
jgi:hypothetical protein